MTGNTYITTSALASMLGVKAESIRTHLYRKGSYYDLKPSKAVNGRLMWPADAAEHLLAGGGEQREGEAA